MAHPYTKIVEETLPSPPNPLPPSYTYISAREGCQDFVVFYVKSFWHDVVEQHLNQKQMSFIIMVLIM